MRDKGLTRLDICQAELRVPKTLAEIQWRPAILPVHAPGLLTYVHRVGISPPAVLTCKRIWLHEE